MLGGDLDDGLEAKAVKFEDSVVGSVVVHLVDGQHDRDATDAELSSHLVVSRNRSLAPVHDEDHHVDGPGSLPATVGDRLPHRIFADPHDAAGVDQREDPLLPLDRPRQHVPGRPGDRRHDCPACSGQSVEDRRLADVGPPYEGDPPARESLRTRHL